MANCLIGTDAWRDVFFAWLDDVALTVPDGDVICDIYNPCDFMTSIIFGWRNRLESYLPEIDAAVDAPRPDGRQLVGCLVWTGVPVSSVPDAIHSVYTEPSD